MSDELTSVIVPADASTDCRTLNDTDPRPSTTSPFDQGAWLVATYIQESRLYVTRNRGTFRGILDLMSSTSFGALIKDLRQSHNWSQSDLASALCQVSGRPTISREEVHRWETGKIIPGRYWLGYLAQVFKMPLDVLTSQARLARMDRRGFMALSALTVAHGKVAAEIVADIAHGDYGPLTQVQTTHGTDLVIASFADQTAHRKLRSWMYDGENAILRVNAAGILAKTPGQEPAKKVAAVLANDVEMRQLYTTAVVARVGALPWSTASKLATGEMKPSVKQANFLASRFAAEVLNPRDAGARWCSAAMLSELSPLVGTDKA